MRLGSISKASVAGYDLMIEVKKLLKNRLVVNALVPRVQATVPHGSAASLHEEYLGTPWDRLIVNDYLVTWNLDSKVLGQWFREIDRELTDAEDAGSLPPNAYLRSTLSFCGKLLIEFDETHATEQK